MSTYGDPQRVNLEQINATDGTLIMDVVLPDVAQGNWKIYVPDAAIPAALLQAEYTGSNIDMGFIAKGTGGFLFGNENTLTGGEQLFSIQTGTATPANYGYTKASATGNNVEFGAIGTDTNISVEYKAQGSGVRNFNKTVNWTDSSFWIPYAKTVPVTAKFDSSSTNEVVFTAPDNQDMYVLNAFAIFGTAGSDAGSVYLQLTTDSGTQAAGAGTEFLTNNTNNGFDLKATANTLQKATFSGSPGVFVSGGSRVSMKFTGTLTALAKGSLTLYVTYAS